MNIGLYQSYWGPVGGGQRYLAVVAELLSRDHQVEIIHHNEGFQPRTVEEPMQVDLSKVNFRCVPKINRQTAIRIPLRSKLHFERQLGRELSEPYDLYLDSSDTPPYFNHARKGVLLTHFPLTSFDRFYGREIPNWKASSLLKRTLKHCYQNFEWRSRVSTYDLVLTNSAFTQKWLKQLWKIHSEILFPPLRKGLKPQAKKNVILSIGAYRAAQHKKHAVMIDAFREMYDTGMRGWEYRLVGSLGPNQEDREYLESLRKRSDGYPISVECNLSGSEMSDALETSTILWHSMGYGVDTKKDPGRMEHFGMVATEAMAAACIPIVFNGGGLPEIVTDGRNGFLWSNLNELKQKTQKILTDETCRNTMARAALSDVERFSHNAFEERFHAAMDPILSN